MRRPNRLDGHRLEVKYLVLSVAFLSALAVLARGNTLGGFDGTVNDAMNEALRFGFIGIFLVALIANLSLVIQIPYTLPLLGAALQGFGFADMLGLGIAAGLGAGLGGLGSFVIASKLLERTPDLTGSRLYQWVNRSTQARPRQARLAVFVVAATPLPDDTVIIPLAMIRYGWRRIAVPYLIGKLVHNVAVAIAFFEFTRWFIHRADANVRADGSLALAIVFVLLACYQAEKVRASNVARLPIEEPAA